MLPQNRLKDQMLSRLHIFAQEEHRFADKFNK
jgi:ribosomal protein L13